MADTDSILDRLGAAFQDAYEQAQRREADRAAARAASATRATRWAGLVRDPDFLATNALRSAHLARTSQQAQAIRADLETVLASARRLADPAARDKVRVFGRIASPEAGGEADLIDAEGCVIASAPIDRLGGYSIVTDATGEEVRLEIRDAKGQRAVLDGRPLKLTPGLAVRRDFSTGRGGRVDPIGPEPKPTEMPDLVGKSIDDARATLDALGKFRITEDRHSDDGADKDSVTAQIPAPGQPLQDGALILLAVSDGAEEGQQMPDLIGAKEAEALKLLSGFTYRTVRLTQVRDPERAGTVVEQSPEAGADLTARTDITLCLAVRALLMPRVAGLSRKKALEILIPAYVDAPKIDEEPDDGPPDRVLAQSPKTGEAIENGVHLKVSVPKESKAALLVMPRLIGMTRAEAQAALVPVFAKEVAFESRPERGRPGLVVAQDPKPGTKTPKSIRLTLSAPVKNDDGPTMPDLRGKPLDISRRTLKPLTDSVAVEQRQHKTAPGTVLDQRPAPGQPIRDGATLIVAVPPDTDEQPGKTDAAPKPKNRPARSGTPRPRTAPKLSKMPDVTGLTLAGARKALSKAGLGDPSYDSGDAHKRGHRVVEQSPRAGRPVAPGADVALTFGKPGKDGPA